MSWFERYHSVSPRLWAVIVVTAGCTLGCPTFEDSYTGHYQEIEFEELQDEAVAVDLFRFGDDVQAVFREYDIGSASAKDAPFDAENEVRCQWTRVDRFHEDTRSFGLTIPSTVRRAGAELRGEIDEDGVMQLEIDGNESDEPRSVKLEPGEEPASADCTTIDDFLIRAIFDESEGNQLSEEVHELENPVFTLLWASVQPTTSDGVIRYVKFNRAEPAVRLDPGTEYVGNSLIGSLSVMVPAPAEQTLVESGDTRYALAHFVVIDDDADDESEDSFSWASDEEPIVATALEEGRPAGDGPDIEDINRSGKALLFVEGRLDELSDSLTRNFDGMDGAEEARHFYIVDIFAEDDEVRSLSLPARPEPNQPVQRRVRVQMTDEFLESDNVDVPRLFPYN